MTVANPVRFPDLRSPGTMTRRGWWLVGLNAFIPGSAQLIAGSRRLGRFGVRSTFLLWGFALVGALVFWLLPRVVYAVVTNMVALTIIQVVLAAYAVLWVILTLDTLRLVRLVHAGPRARSALAFFAVVAVALVAGTAGYGAVIAGAARSTLQDLFSNGSYQEPINGQYNVLLLGGDAGPDRTGMRPDSMTVASINADSGAVTMIGLPRNFEEATFRKGSPLWGPFPTGYDCGDECLLNYLYTYGEEHPDLYPDALANGSTPGIEATRDAVSGITGLTLQYFVVIDMQGFAELVDALGGVTVEVPVRTAIGPITAEKPLYYVDPGLHQFTGDEALWYARSRFDSTDYDRMQRQRQVQQAILAQFQPAQVLSKFESIAKAGAQVISTDVPAVMLPGFVVIASKSRVLPVTTLELVPGVVDTLHPDYEAIHALVQSTITASVPAQ